MGELGGRAAIFPPLAFSGVVSVVIGSVSTRSQSAGRVRGPRLLGAGAALSLYKG